jgi:2-polyprenyl-3-methyl-5-hydroxy-6-metoxy-1,4-benzoquinol methylase
MDNNFNEGYYSKDMKYVDNDKVRIKFILENIEDNHLDILDIGCWDGAYACQYKKLTNTVYGIESSKTASDKAENKGIIVEQGYFPDDRLFKNKKFDIIVAGEIIEHVFDTEEFLLKIKEKLKKNGKLIITTPNIASLPRRALLLMGLNPMIEYRAEVGHIRYFTFSNLRNMLKELGFEVVKEASDVINFTGDGRIYDTNLVKIHKEWGRSILIVCKNQ